MATLLTRRRRRAPSRSTFLRTLAPRFPSFVLLLRAPPSRLASPAPLSRLRADSSPPLFLFWVVSSSSRRPSWEPRRRAPPRSDLGVPSSVGDWETWGGSPEATSPSPGTPGIWARRRGVSGAEPLARPNLCRLERLESKRTGVWGGGQRIAPRTMNRPVPRIASTNENARRRVGNGGPRRTLGVAGAVRHLRRAHGTTRSTPSEEEGGRSSPRARGSARRGTRHLETITFSAFRKRLGGSEKHFRTFVVRLRLTSHIIALTHFRMRLSLKLSKRRFNRCRLETTNRSSVAR